MRTLTITFENQDQLVVPFDAIEHFAIDNVTTKCWYHKGGDLHVTQVADRIILDFYIDAIKELKTKDMQHFADEKDKNVVERLQHPDILDVQIDNHASVYAPWDISNDYRNNWQTSKIHTLGADNKEMLQIIIEKKGKTYD